MNRALYQAKLQQKEKCIKVLSHSPSHFNRLLEVSSYEAFRLRWDQALSDRSTCVFSGPDEYNDLNKVERNHYDLEYYVSKENLTVAFADKLEDETKTQGGGSQASKSDHLDPVAKGQVDSKS